MATKPAPNLGDTTVGRGSNIAAGTITSNYDGQDKHPTTIGDEVFIGHAVVFTNDKHPRATAESGELQTEADWELERTFVERGASIGSGAVVLSGIRIGEGATIGAGAIVTRDVPPHAVFAGNPARALARQPPPQP